MRERNYEILVMDSSNQTIFPEKEVNGVQYIVAEPGMEYFVKVNVYRNVDGSWPAKYLRAGLFVDGKDVQYWKRLDFTDQGIRHHDLASASFWGFKKDAIDLRSFIFANPSITDGTCAAESMTLGQIKVVIYEAIVTEGVFDNRSGSHHVPQAPDCILEGKKFWQQASLTTTAGRSVSEKEKFQPLLRWSNVSAEPLYEATLNYHTDSVLSLLETSTKADTSTASISASSVGAETISSSSRKRPVEVDLTADSDDDEGQAGATASSSSSLGSHMGEVLAEYGGLYARQSSATKRQRDSDSGQEIDDEVQYVDVPKHIVLVDISDERATPQVSHVLEYRR